MVMLFPETITRKVVKSLFRWLTVMNVNRLPNLLIKRIGGYCHFAGGFFMKVLKHQFKDGKIQYVVLDQKNQIFIKPGDELPSSLISEYLSNLILQSRDNDLIVAPSEKTESNDLINYMTFLNKVHNTEEQDKKKDDDFFAELNKSSLTMQQNVTSVEKFSDNFGPSQFIMKYEGDMLIFSEQEK